LPPCPASHRARLPGRDAVFAISGVNLLDFRIRFALRFPDHDAFVRCHVACLIGSVLGTIVNVGWRDA